VAAAVAVAAVVVAAMVVVVGGMGVANGERSVAVGIEAKSLRMRGGREEGVEYVLG